MRTIARLGWLLVLLAVAAQAQVAPRRVVRSPLRAVALLQLNGEGGAVLIPISVFTENRFYDASLYRTMPSPLALWPNTIYEGFQLGESKGLFTVGSARRFTNNRWFGLGEWTPAKVQADNRKLLVGKRDMPPPPPPVELSDPSRPQLHRRPGSEGDATPVASQTSATTAADGKTASQSSTSAPSSKANPQDENRPVLHRAGEQSSDNKGDSGVLVVQTAKNGAPLPQRDEDTANSAPGATAPTSAGKISAPPVPGDDDPDRPVLRRPQDKKNAAPENQRDVAGVEPQADDPDRPKLRHGKPGGAAQMSEALLTSLDKDVNEPQYLVAVSDVRTESNRPMRYLWNNDLERQAQLERMKSAAAVELREASRHASFQVADLLYPPPSAKSKNRKSTRAVPPPLKPTADPIIKDLQNVEMTAIDTDYSNTPLLILRARYTPVAVNTASGTGSPEEALLRQRGVAVLLICRLNWDNELQKVFAAVSDPGNLDDRPEFRFIDAVDADGGGRAALLLERREASARRFSLYKIAGRSMTELFTTLPR